MTILLDYLVLNYYLGYGIIYWYLNFKNSSYIYIKLIIYFFIYYFLNFLLPYFNYNEIFDISLNVTDNNAKLNVGTNATVNVNNPNISPNVSTKVLIT